MTKGNLRLVSSRAVNGTMPPKRVPNAELRTREYLDEFEIERLMTTAKANRNGQRDAAMILIAFRHGLRAAEIVDLRWDQVDLGRNACLHVRRVKHGMPSVHPLQGDEMRALRALKRESAFVFVSERGAPFTRAGFAKMIARAGQAAGFKLGVHPHMLRHACGYALANRGHDTRALQAVPVWNKPGTDEATMRIPNPDPGELWTDINAQLFGSPSAPPPGQVPTMNGFVRNYLAQEPLNPAETYDPRSVVHYFTPDQVPVLSTIAKQFAVCDRWFAAAPCQTWPNRWFVHAATADRHENNKPLHFPDAPTIFNSLELAGIDNWKSYFHDFAQAHTLLQLFLLGNHFHSYLQFQASGPQPPPSAALASVHDARDYVKRQAGNYFQSH